MNMRKLINIVEGKLQEAGIIDPKNPYFSGVVYFNNSEKPVRFTFKTLKKVKANSHFISREDGPAICRDDGTEEYWIDGRIQREVSHTKEKYYDENGKSHRDDGPAIKNSNGDEFWYKHGKRHREDGPAVKFYDGEDQYWLDGVPLSKEEWEKKVNG